LLVIIPLISEGASFGLGFSYLREGPFWSAGYMGALLEVYPLARLRDFERPGLFSAYNLYRDARPLSAFFTARKERWAGAAEGLFAMQGDTLTSDRVLLGTARLYRDMGPWAWGFGFSYSDFSYKQRTLGVWRNWAIDTRTVLPSLELVLPVGDASLSTTLSAGYAESLGGDVLLPMGIEVAVGSQGRSVRFSYLTLSNTAAARGLMGVAANGSWGLREGMRLAAAGQFGVGVGGSAKRYGGVFSCEIAWDTGILTVGSRLRAASYTDDSLSRLAVQDGLTLECAMGPVSLIARPQVTYYSSGQWIYGALGGTSISAGPFTARALAGRLDIDEGFAFEANMEVKLW